MTGRSASWTTTPARPSTRRATNPRSSTRAGRCWGPGSSRYDYTDKVHFEKPIPLGDLIYLDRDLQQQLFVAILRSFLEKVEANGIFAVGAEGREGGDDVALALRHFALQSAVDGTSCIIQKLWTTTSRGSGK